MEDYKEVSGDFDEEGNRLFKNTDSNGRFHTDWLNMMYPRLKLARDLLSDDGVIFISIDDNEVKNLRNICDEIFGEANFIGELVWHKKTQPSFLSKEVANIKEYALFYKKDSKETIKTFGGLTDTNKHIEMINISNRNDIRIIKKDNLLVSNGKFNGVLEPGIYGNGDLKIELQNKVNVELGKPEEDMKLYGRFKWAQETMEASFTEGDIYHIKSIKSLRPTVEKKNKKPNIKATIDILSKKFDRNIATNTDANKEIRNIFDGELVMDYPKPVNYIKYLIKAITYESNDRNNIILDFFSGSATTAHAVMELNAEDGLKVMEKMRFWDRNIAK